MKKLVIFGTAQIAEVIGFYFLHDSEYEVVGYTVDGSYLKETTFQKRPVVPFENLTECFPATDHELFIAISYQSMNRLRADKYDAAKREGYTLAKYVSSKATVWPGLTMGENSFVMEDNTVQPFAEIGHNTIIWSGNHIGHHTKIGNHCFISSHVVISGNVSIGDRSFLGVNATLRNNISLGEATLVGAGATLLSDTDPGSVYAAKEAELKRIKSDDLKSF